MLTLPPAPVGEDSPCSIVPRRPRDSSTWMGTGAAQIEALERHTVVRGADHRPCAEQLVEAHLAMENVAADQSEAALEVERRVDLPADHRLGEARRVAVDQSDDRVRRSFALV